MEQSLIEEVKEMGGVVNPIQGSLYVRIQTKGDPSKFWIVAFYFSSFDELLLLGRKVRERGYHPFSDVIDLNVKGTDVMIPRQEQGPSCPYHGDENIKPSKRKSGSFYCATRLFDGSFCKWEG